MRHNLILGLLLLSSVGAFANRIDVLKDEYMRWFPELIECESAQPAPFDVNFSRWRMENSSPDRMGIFLKKIGVRGENLSRPVSPMSEDLLLGFYNPDTVMVIDYDTTIFANIMLVNNAQLIIRDCHFTFGGDIYAVGNSRFVVEDADFDLIQDFIYQYMFAAIDSAHLGMRRVNFSTSHFPAGAAATGIATLSMDSVDMGGDAFLTFSLMEGCSMSIEYTDGAGEFVMLGDSCCLRISHSDTILLWLGFLKNSSGEINGTFSMDDFIAHFEFPDSTCSGIGYSAVLDSLSGLMIATMADDSSDVVVNDCDLYACGNIFHCDCDDTIIGLVNGARYDHFSPSLPNRSLTLNNSSVRCWNFYDFGSGRIVYMSSIFGECLTDSVSNTTIMNSTCDGAGGHIGANRNSFLTVFFSTMFTDALLEGNSISMFLLTSFVMGNIIARDRALALTYNTPLTAPILVYDSSAVFEVALYPPSSAYVDDSVSISGTAAITRTESAPFEYVGYRVEYSPIEDTTTFFHITETMDEQVRDGELCRFSTFGLDVGYYIVRLWYIFSSYGSVDSVAFDNTLYLNYNAKVEEKYLPDEFCLLTYPNPFNSALEIAIGSGGNINSADAVDGQIVIFDLSGNVIFKTYISPVENFISGERRLVVWVPGERVSSGVYFVEFLTKDGVELRRKVVFIR